MRDDICTIPVSDVFEKVDGCPICRMRDTVEEKILDYIMGAAMMEPDVREETNKTGFCREHIDMMMNRRGRLALALMLETHLKSINEEYLTKKKLFDSSPAKKAAKARETADDCFICKKVNWGMDRMTDMLYRLYENEADFRRLFDAQECFCFEHYTMLISGADKKLMKSYYGEFTKSLSKTTSEYISGLCADMRKYCSMYDYRNSGQDADLGNSRDAVERSVEFLTGRYPK